eukprot:1364568-Pleurochrysis_carterae.AAC.1
MEAVLISTGQLLPRAHDYTVTRGAEISLDQDVAMLRVRFEGTTQTRTKRTKMHNGNAKTCKCACNAINLG